jgi:hypothetical protein
MAPDRCELVHTNQAGLGEPRTFVPFPIEYDPDDNALTIPAILVPGKANRLELVGFRGADGGPVDTIEVEYHVGDDLFSSKEQARIAEAGRSARLRELVAAVHGTRRELESVEETVRTTHLSADRSRWFSQVRSDWARFWLQGDRQFCADVSSIMNITFRVGSDGDECWFLAKDEVVGCPFDAVDVKNVVICDPLGAKRYDTAEEAIRELKLEYLGTVEHDGAACHRIRSWRASVSRHWTRGFRDWLFDAETLLPVVEEEFASIFHFRHDVVYHRVNEPLPVEAFQPPADAALNRRDLEPLGEGYNRRFLNACDGSDGRMTVRWGKTGPAGRSSSGLN